MTSYRVLNVRYDVLRNNSKITELIPIAGSAGFINADYSSAIKTGLSGIFMGNEAVNWYSDEIQPVIELDGVEHKMGVYAPATIERKHINGTSQVSIECYDRAWRLSVTSSDGLVFFQAGTNYISAIESLLQRAGITMLNIVPTSYTMATDREDWDLGTDFLKITNDLLREINYSELWFDRDGYAVIEPAPTTITEPVRTYNCNDPKDLIIDDMTSIIDLYNAPNVFIVSCDNPELPEPLSAMARNDSSTSSLSTISRGIEIYNFSTVDNTPDQMALDDYAKALCFNSTLSNESVTIDTLIHPEVKMNSVVYVNTPNVSGVYLETGWELTLEPGGIMTHTLRRFL